MQWKNKNSLILINTLGKIIKRKRLETKKTSLNLFAYEYDMTPGNLSRIENGQIEPKIVMLWRISEALGIPLSELLKEVENELGLKFKLFEE